jgi:hypothetical protein
MSREKWEGGFVFTVAELHEFFEIWMDNLTFTLSLLSVRICSPERMLVCFYQQTTVQFGLQ